MGGPIAQEEAETLFIDGGHADGIRQETFVLQADGALGQPPGLGHVMDEHLFGGVGGLVLGEKGFEEGPERGRVFASNHERA